MSVTFEHGGASAGGTRSTRSSRRAAHPTPSAHTLLAPAPRPALVQLAVALAGVGFGATVGLAITAETSSQLHAPGGVAMFLGNLTGMAGTYLALVMILLVSRIPQIERVLGQDGLLRWHRRLSPWPISLIVAHAVLLTYAYAEATRSGIAHQLSAFVASYSGMLLALVGFGVFAVIAVASVHSIRRRMPRERWWALHLGMYLAFAFAFLHEVALGPSFVGHPATQIIWGVAWAATAGLVLTYRVGLPAWRSCRHRLRVEEVREEAPGVTSVILRGRNLERLAVSGGQFFEWRFLTRGMWWQAHPYSMSARPRPPFLRLTVKAVGDHSSGVAALRPGTRVVVEGPYGAFTAHARRRQKAAFLVGGIGITAARSLLEDLTKASEPFVVWRVHEASDAALEQEIRTLLGRLKGTLHVLSGSREEVPMAEAVRLIPELRRRDVFVSGGEGFVQAALAVLEHRGVTADAVHYEVYAL
ncbi:MAG TPA: ferredoxin reductase family protein [Acidimicrobiales bacterium]|nr:ferredoxin reductase family protein [Acidimicrobiales bacterium]